MTALDAPLVIDRNACSLDDFRADVETNRAESSGDRSIPLVDHFDQGIAVFTAETLRACIAADGNPAEVLRILAQVLDTGPGVFAITGAIEPDVVDRASDGFWEMIADQHARGQAVGDHYAKPGANDRVWNTIEKLAVADPATWVDYHCNDMLAIASLAWLGPNYQISSQVNVVHPGGEAQQPHRDYHLGFMTLDEAEQYPRHAHLLSPMLTLQGGVAHCDMSVASGPTKLLPYSQRYPLGYLAWRRPEFIEYFEANYAQMAMNKGDAVFFNPALFHAAGTNQTESVKRMVNLFQVSSPMGRALETIDRIRIAKAVYPTLLARVQAGMPDDELAYVATAAAEGYAFPTNLDNDPPIGGLTPPSQRAILLDALAQGTAPAEFNAQLDALVERRRSV